MLASSVEVRGHVKHRIEIRSPKVKHLEKILRKEITEKETRERKKEEKNKIHILENKKI